MVKKPEHSDEQLLEILSKAQNDRDYIERLEKTLKQAKKLIKRDKYTPLTCPRCNQGRLIQSFIWLERVNRIPLIIE